MCGKVLIIFTFQKRPLENGFRLEDSLDGAAAVEFLCSSLI